MTVERPEEFDSVLTAEKDSEFKEDDVKKLTSSKIKDITGDVQIRYVATFRADDPEIFKAMVTEMS